MTSARLRVAILICVALIIFHSKTVWAVGSCTATVSPSSVMTSTDTNFAFSITNNGSQNITYVKITRPSSNFTLENYGVSGWNVNANNSFAELTGGSVSPGSTLNFNYHGTSGSSEASSADWTVQTNDGSGVVNCTGSLGTEISGVADVTPPILSEVTVSSITSTSVNLSWTTNEDSDSIVDYGLDSDFGLNSTNSTATTSHSVTLSGLSANTTYYYQVRSVDPSGNTGYGDLNNFTTAIAGISSSTSTPTATPRASATATSTSSSATATPFVDRVAPRISITSDVEETYEEAPEISGEASDAIGVTDVEYSIDGGLNWLPVDEITEVDGQEEVEFVFVPNIFEDGNYTVLARALDEAGNSGETETITIVIDRLPPRVGGNLVSLGPLPLHPNADGSIITIPGLEQRVTLSSVGGATSIDLFVNTQMASLGFNAQTGLWTGALNLREPGRYLLSTRAKDGAGNVTERSLNEVVVVPPGSIYKPDSKEKVEKGKVTVYVQDPLTKLWSLWDAKTFGQENPQNLIEGTYSFFLPPGIYYLTVTDTGFTKLTSKIFQVTEARPLVSDFNILKRQSLQLGPISIPLPDMFQDKASVVFKKFTNEQSSDPLIGKLAPSFSLPGTSQGLSMNDLKGERTVISFINTWSPPAVEQLPLLDEYFEENAVSHAIIAVEETIPRVAVFSRRGGYNSEILSDRDGELVENYNITSLPKHLFIDRQGIVRNVVSGVLSKEEIAKYLSAI